MSYDLRLLQPRPGESIEDTADRDEDEGARSSPPDPAKEARKRNVAEALREHDPYLELFNFDYEELAKLHKISLAEAQRRYRYLELTEDATGIQVTLFDDEAGVTVPYWHSGERAFAVLQRMLDLAGLIARETGYVIYDLQLGRTVDPVTDLDEILDVYTGHVRRLEESHPGFKKKPGRPWWKFW